MRIYVHRKGRWQNKEAVEYATLAWVHWFNIRQLMEPIGDVPPVEIEMLYYQQPKGVSRSGLTQTKEFLE